MKAHPMVGDSLLAGLLAGIDLLIFVAQAAQNPHTGPVPKPWYVAIPLILGTVTPLVFRRRHPVLSAYLILLVGTPHSILELGIASLVGTCIALYTLVAYVSRRQGLIFVGANLVSAAIQLPLQAHNQGELILMIAVGGGASGFCWLLGEF